MFLCQRCFFKGRNVAELNRCGSRRRDLLEYFVFRLKIWHKTGGILPEYA